MHVQIIAIINVIYTTRVIRTLQAMKAMKVIDVSHERSQMSGACPSLVLLVTTGLALLQTKVRN